jgi:hypothetical protein
MIWIIWVLLFLVVLFFLGTIFYKQTIQEYRINQLDWDNRSKLIDIWEERVPIVVRDTPLPPIWTKSDIEVRKLYQNFKLNVPGGSTAVMLRDWILGAPYDAVCPWNSEDAATFAAAAGFEPWIRTIWLPCMDGIKSWAPSLFPLVPRFWAGARGLSIFTANWTLIFPTENSIIVTLLTEKENEYLPSQWKNSFPRQYTNADTPYVSSIQYLDVILRPGHSLWVPAHWKVAWEAEKKSDITPLVCTIDVHSPISLISYKSSIASSDIPNSIIVGPVKKSNNSKLKNRGRSNK